MYTDVAVGARSSQPDYVSVVAVGSSRIVLLDEIVSTSDQLARRQSSEIAITLSCSRFRRQFDRLFHHWISTLELVVSRIDSNELELHAIIKAFFQSGLNAGEVIAADRLLWRRIRVVELEC